jgi:hypothetical protein
MMSLLESFANIFYKSSADIVIFVCVFIRLEFADRSNFDDYDKPKIIYPSS